MPITVPYYERDGSGDIGYDRDGGSASLTFITEYRDADQFCQEALGVSFAGGQAVQFRVTPLQHPRRPHLYCRAASHQGLGVAKADARDGLATYTKAVCTLQFQPLERPESDQSTADGVFLTESREPVSSLITMPPGADNSNALYWTAGPEEGYGLHDNQTVTQIQTFLRIRISIRQWEGHDPSDPDDPFITFINHINDEKTTFLWQRWPKHTLLYEGGSMSRDYTPAGRSAWRLDMSFLYNRNTWLKLMASDGLYYKVEAEDGALLYPDADFRKLLPR